MDELTERQKFILTLVIHEYTRSATPVGSQNLVEMYHLGMSSATVRNELAALTEMNYLRQPHTSAGRVPTEEGYRYFVGRLLQKTDLPESMRHTISHQFYQMRDDTEQWMRLAASVLAKQSQSASLVTAPHPQDTLFKHVELISTRGRQVLMVLVMVGGEIRERLVTLTEQATQEQLSVTAERISHLFRGKDADAIQAMQSMLTSFEQETMGLVLEEMRMVNQSVSGEVYVDGIKNILSEPEFTGPEEARRAIQMLEERTALQDLILRSAVMNNSIGGVQVLIGGEGTYEELRQCSVILAQYGAPGLATGTLGVLGPMRLPYGRSISTIRFLSSLLSDMVVETQVS